MDNRNWVPAAGGSIRFDVEIHWEIKPSKLAESNRSHRLRVCPYFSLSSGKSSRLLEAKEIELAYFAAVS